ncbi:MAG: hypothetical protein QOD99_1133 [Chthoniobacter sp.]|nr:hypothetical protein [Chthoniobacter sp.]
MFARPVRFQLGVLTAASLFSLGGTGAAAQPFDSATVTRIENQVSVGQGAKAAERPAAVSDVIKGEEYLRTLTEARAELKFSDHSIVRVGQNSVFTFDAGSRTLSLEKGTMLFYIPPGSGGGQIKTRAFTAAVTGTIGLVSENLIAVLRGTLHTQWGDVPKGWAVDSSGHIFQFDLDEVVKTSKLFNFGGPPPSFPLGSPLAPVDDEVAGVLAEFPGLPDLHFLDIQEATQINPRVRDFLNTPHEVEPVAPPTPTPTPTPTPKPVRSPGQGQVGRSTR